MTDFYDNSDVPENAIEWLKGRKTATVTLAGRTTLNTRIRKLAKSHPGKCSIRDENEDGTIVAHIPVSWIKFYPERELSEEERERLSAFGKQNVANARAVAQRKRAETRLKGKK